MSDEYNAIMCLVEEMRGLNEKFNKFFLVLEKVVGMVLEKKFPEKEIDKETTVTETVEYEKIPEVKEKVLTTSGMAKLPKDLNKSTLDFNKTHKIYKDACNKCAGMITFEYYGKGIRYPIHIDANGKIIGNGTCPEYKGDS